MQATRIITGAMKSTPIIELETITGLHSLEDRRDTKMLVQAAKFKRLPTHPMKERLEQPTKGRLKRGSFVHQACFLERRDQELLDHEPREIPKFLKTPTWRTGQYPSVNCSIPGVHNKGDQSDIEMKYYTIDHINTQYPQDKWTRVYTDGSAERAVKNGVAGIYIKYPNGHNEKIAEATGVYSTNYKAEVLAIQMAATHVINSPCTSQNVVFLSDAMSVLQAIEIHKDQELNNLFSSLENLCKTHIVHLQWIPSHCGVLGNEMADALAKEGSGRKQEVKSTGYEEAKTIIKAKQQDRWKQQHPCCNKQDAYHQLSRVDQVLIFRLRTGHNRLNHHMYTKFKIGPSEICPCQTSSMTTEHLLQECPLYNTLRIRVWPQSETLDKKLFGSLTDLQRTASFVLETGVPI